MGISAQFSARLRPIFLNHIPPQPSTTHIPCAMPVISPSPPPISRHANQPPPPPRGRCCRAVQSGRHWCMPLPNKHRPFMTPMTRAPTRPERQIAHEQTPWARPHPFHCDAPTNARPKRGRRGEGGGGQQQPDRPRPRPVGRRRAPAPLHASSAARTCAPATPAQPLGATFGHSALQRPVRARVCPRPPRRRARSVHATPPPPPVWD